MSDWNWVINNCEVAGEIIGFIFVSLYLGQELDFSGVLPSLYISLQIFIIFEVNLRLPMPK